MRMRSNVLAFCCLAACNLQAASPFPPECPQRGTMQIQQDPAAWADQCFAAINGRLPQADRIGETDSAMRDVDLDGVDERLEIRGVGNSIKQIYVFKATARGYAYVGKLNAHPSFIVALDASGIPTISYTYRSVASSLSTIRIQYRDGLYMETRSDQDH